MYKKDQFNLRLILQVSLHVMDILQMVLKRIKFSILWKVELFLLLIQLRLVILLVNKIAFQYVHFITQPQIHYTGKSIVLL